MKAKAKHAFKDGQKVYAVIQEEITKTCPACGNEEKANGKWIVVGPGIINLVWWRSYEIVFADNKRATVWERDIFKTKKEARVRADKENKELQC